MGKPKNNSKVQLKRVLIPEKVLIGGKWWKLKPYTKKIRKALKEVGPKGIAHSSVGATWVGSKLICYQPVQHREELLDTLVHEGLHAILYERSNNPLWAAMCQDEQSVEILTSELLGYLKQIVEIKFRETKE